MENTRFPLTPTRELVSNDILRIFGFKIPKDSFLSNILEVFCEHIEALSTEKCENITLRPSLHQKTSIEDRCQEDPGSSPGILEMLPHFQRIRPDHAPSPRRSYLSTISCNMFEKLKVLGVGTFGKVILVKKRKCGSLFAMKIVKKNTINSAMKPRILMERNVMANHPHPFIVKLHWAFQQDTKLFFVMDFCEGGDLYYHMYQSASSQRMIRGNAKFFIAQLTLALGHLHKHGIMYRDLKPENILFDSNGYIKLADFGLTKGGVYDPLCGAKSLCGSLHYMAPEVLFLNQKDPNAEYGTCADWWGLGVLYYEIICGLPPWLGNDYEDMVRRLRTIDLRIPGKLPSKSKQFMKQILTKDPTKRLGFQGCKQVQAHEYFDRVDFDCLLRKEYKPKFVPHSGISDHAICNFDDVITRLPLESCANDVQGQSNPETHSQFYDSFDFISTKN